MKALIKIIYKIAFFLVLLLNHVFNLIKESFSIFCLKMQKFFFEVSKANLKRRQKNKFKRINDRHTKIHLKELADLIENELNKYQKDIDEKNFYRLKRLISTSLKKKDLKKLSVFYTILFETPKTEILVGLCKFSKSRR